MSIPSRAVWAGSAAVVVALAVSGCAGDGASTESTTTLTVQVWADAAQAKQYEEVFDVYEKAHPGTQIDLDWMDWRVFQDKLNTKMAAGDPPDVFFMVGVWMGEYVSRDALLDFTQYPDDIDLSAIDPDMLASAKEGGALYGVPTGTTAGAMVYNTRIVEQAGLALPDDTAWSWDDFAAFNAKIHEATGIYGTGFDVSYPPNFGTYVRQQGEQLFTPDGQLGVSSQTVADYFSMVDAMRASGAYAAPGVIDDAGKTTAESALGKGVIASQTIPANLFPDYNSALDGDLALLRFPGEAQGVTPGVQVTPTLVWAAAARGEHPAQAAQLVDFLTNDPASFAARSTLLGVPLNPEVAAEVAKTLDPDAKTFVDYVVDLQKGPLVPYTLEPAGAGEVWNALTSVTTEVEFGRLTPRQAADRFLSEAEAALAG